MDSLLFDHFKELMVIAVVNMKADDYRAYMVQRFPYWSYFVGSSGHLTSSSDSAGGAEKCPPQEDDFFR